MPAPSLLTPEFQSAQQLLIRFSSVESRSVSSEAEQQQLQQAVLHFTELSEQQNLGICADNLSQGVIALTRYLNAMGYGVPDAPESVDAAEDEPIYIKFSTQRMSYYVESYSGQDRGVLMSCQSSQHDALNGTYGYLPLNLFDSPELVSASAAT